MQTISMTGRSWRPWLGQVMLAGSRRSRLGDIPDLDDGSFSQILDAQAAVVDFWSPSCLPCLKYKPTFLTVAGQVQNVTFATVNADESPDTMKKYGIDSIPATLFFLNGSVVNQTSGPMTADDLTAAIRNMMISTPPATPPPTASPTPPDQVAPAAPTPSPLPPPPVTPPSQAAPPAPTPSPTPTPAPTRTPAPAQQTPAAKPAAAVAAPAQDSGTLKTILLIGGAGILAVGVITLFVKK